ASRRPALHSFPTRRSSDLRSLWRDDTHPSSARAANSASQPFEGSRHPMTGEERGGQCRRERESEDDPDRRVELDTKVLEPVLRRSEEHTSELQSLAYLVCR